MTKSPNVFLLVVLALFVECSFSMYQILSDEECNRFTSVEIRYNEFFELYLGHSAETGKISEGGIMYRSLMKAIGDCCRSTPVKFTKIREQIETLVQNDVLYHHRNGTNSSELVFYFPEFTKQTTTRIYSYDLPFLKLRKSPGFALIMLKSESYLNISASDIILPSWPIFALVLALSLAVGILAWFLDNFTNREDFPRPFIRGMFSGFWWAVVTMSTVGYGDKTPKSYPARILAVIWILAGAILLSLFTANTTSIITTSKIGKNGETMGKKIGIVNMLDFVEAELNLGARLISYNDVYPALQALRNKTIDRMLFPHYLDLLYLMTDDEFQHMLSDLHIAKVFDKPFQIGMILSHGNAEQISNHRFYTCMEIMTSRYSKKFNYDYSEINEEVVSHNTFDTVTTLQFLYGILGIIGAMVSLGFVFDVVRFFRKRGKLRVTSPQNGVV